MWLATRHGFFSITTSPTHEGNMQIRARCQHDLKTLIEVHGLSARIVETPPPADYRWRIVVNHDTLAAIMYTEVLMIDYGNFKAAVHATAGQENKSGPYLRVWSAMRAIQEPEPAPDEGLFEPDHFTAGPIERQPGDLDIDPLDNPRAATLPPHTGVDLGQFVAKAKKIVGKRGKKS